MAIQKVTSDLIADDAVTAAKIANNTITAAQLANNTVTAAQLANNTVTATQLANNSVGLSQLNLSDGTSGQFLKTDGSGTLSFADAGGGGGGAWNVIGSNTVSSATGGGSNATTSSIIFTGVTGYKYYKLLFTGVNHTGSNSVMGLRFSADGGSNWTGSVTWKGVSIRYRSAGNESDAPTIKKNFSGYGLMPIMSSFNEYNNDQQQHGEVTIWGLNDAKWTLTKSSMVNNEGWSPHGLEMNETYSRFESTTVYNAIKINSTSYDIDAGTFTLYGLAN